MLDVANRAQERKILINSFQSLPVAISTKIRMGLANVKVGIRRANLTEQVPGMLLSTGSCPLMPSGLIIKEALVKQDQILI